MRAIEILTTPLPTIFTTEYTITKYIIHTHVQPHTHKHMYLHVNNICDSEKTLSHAQKLPSRCSVAAATQSRLQTGTWLIRSPVWGEYPNEICTRCVYNNFQRRCAGEICIIIYKNKQLKCLHYEIVITDIK